MIPSVTLSNSSRFHRNSISSAQPLAISSTKGAANKGVMTAACCGPRNAEKIPSPIPLKIIASRIAVDAPQNTAVASNNVNEPAHSPTTTSSDSTHPVRTFLDDMDGKRWYAKTCHPEPPQDTKCR